MTDAQTFDYRGVRLLIEHDIAGTRKWTVFPKDQPAQQGYFFREPGRGSFRGAVAAAEAAIDQWVGTERPEGARLLPYVA